ncbi:hypothetical protein VPNG_08235 [Cytospora leucostoma]|uniref:Allergen n=1 Tax=Cytospora leucostoma TaxID=1230097 RepID=A0A423W771_9PEZI|nr:hypothetical protein VPNG_08235 [Cytospora leucostoma]
MEAAKAAVFKHLSRDGHNETEVKETVDPAIQHEHVQPVQHEKIYRPVDKEIHEEHHHTTVQPIQEKEVLPEKHSHINEGTEHKEFRHGDHEHINAQLAEERARLNLTENTREVASTTRTQAEAPTAQGEHVHHHVHEHVQPVIEKDVIQPHVVHRTKGVHEVHHVEPQVHSATTLPPVTIDEFRRQGGHLDGETHVRRDEFRGDPRPVETGYIGGEGARGTTHLTRAEQDRHNANYPEGGRETGLGRENLGREVGTHGHHHGHEREHVSHGQERGIGQNTSSGIGAGTRGAGAGISDNRAPIADHAKHNSHGTGVNSSTSGRISPTTSASSHTKKASLLDKLNPKTDSNGDGKAGFMK